jgi:hypothetical protein
MLTLPVHSNNARSINCQTTITEEAETKVIQLKLFSDSEQVLVIPETLVPLLPNLRYHGYEYTQVCRGRRSSVYRQMLDGKTEGFEVSLIRIQQETVLYGKICKKRERWPKDGDFGKTAWTLFTIEEAMEKYNVLERTADSLIDTKPSQNERRLL